MCQANYSICIDPSFTSDRVFYMIHVNGIEVACCADFQAAQLTAMKIEDELKGFSWLPQAQSFNAAELGA